MGRWLIVCLVGASTVARAEPDTTQMIPDQSRRELRDRLEEDRARVEQEHEVFVERGKDKSRDRELAGLEQSAYESYREHRQHRRHVGYTVIGIGAAFAAGAGVLGYLGQQQNNDIEHGLASAGDIADASSTGRIYNVAAWSALGVGGALALIGASTVLLNLDPGEWSIAPTASSDEKGLVLMGRF
jgi:hypothetical protein